MTNSEVDISRLNSNFFFKEFTFSKNKFKTDEKGKELELADNVIWLDDLLLINQIKEQDKTSDSDSDKWFQNKILNKAVKQIKDTIRYFEIYNDIIIENERGHILNISEARKIIPTKLIIYSPTTNFSNINRFQKFYLSKKVGLIHLFHIEDYLWICKFLVTPCEISEYLSFRETLYKFHGNKLNNYPEQYVLGHYIGSNEDLNLNPSYIEYLSIIENDLENFDISSIIENISKTKLYSTGTNHYYYIIKEIAKLNRADLRAFRLRFDFTLKMAKDQKIDNAYRMTSLKSNCGFIFIPIEFDKKMRCEIVLQNFSIFHKYEQKLDKVVGMVCYYNPQEKYHDILWVYINSPWEFDEELDKITSDDSLLRPVKRERTFKYKIKK